MTINYTPAVRGTGVKATIQRVGGYLAGMVMPNIAAFIAWGLITALFIPTGWIPNATLAALVGPTIKVLLPVLIGYTGGRLVHGQRGAVVGAVATIGVVGGAEAAERGKSILFMIETNPGPGLGLLLAYFLFGPRSLRPTAPAAIIIQ